MKTKTVYVSDDGGEHDTEAEALQADRLNALGEIYETKARLCGMSAGCVIGWSDMLEWFQDNSALARDILENING